MALQDLTLDHDGKKRARAHLMKTGKAESILSQGMESRWWKRTIERQDIDSFSKVVAIGSGFWSRFLPWETVYCSEAKKKIKRILRILRGILIGRNLLDTIACEETRIVCENRTYTPDEELSEDYFEDRSFHLSHLYFYRFTFSR